ncbi:CPXCG motif-containing cysteine-rich protein [Shewanella sp. WXL01]|uniref:CPXCG motif-containing cysteine-rich protein n=1 Tax=Shewanella maritima TaxID=2520507 RepID=A0A411PMB5_9GAMM|nr:MULTISPECIES: CPXCG motif-containing cysteine-rich protein [Shewanella]NKF52688.1 CPXCG motif-containing cysteine-rich protein [Shewanella sp. WXL01]QBF84663.1 CPXCG motif-containing cysteine-rich protein [Shewanella maritima]
MRLINKVISCPHCGHHQHINIDTSLGDQEYYDDCRVCCNPIHMRMHIDEAQNRVELFIDSDDEQVY